jgi:mono/diheme cytochrome c family protein
MGIKSLKGNLMPRFTFILVTLLSMLLLASCTPEENGVPGTGPEEVLPGTPPGDPQASPMAGADQLLRLGEDVYLVQCSMCHGNQGEGGDYTALAGNEFVNQPDPSGLIAFLLYGRDGQHAYAGAFIDEEAAGVLSFIRNNFGNQASFVTAEQVEAVR